MRIDLGCGARKPESFLGVDRYNFQGVDVIADLDESIPFADDSVDLLLAIHSLEHLSDIQKTMSEIWRICRNGAELCIVAPYGSQSLNLANPYHRQFFNEHTTRFWTSFPTSLVDNKEYSHRHAFQWGLAQSDNRKTDIDIRTISIEFFYFPEYRLLGEDEKRVARARYLNVCDQIVYHLVVAKKPMDKEEMRELASQAEHYDPPYVIIRRQAERIEAQASELAQATARISELETQASELARATARISELEAQASELVRASARIIELEAQASELVRASARINELETQASELARATARISELEAQASELAKAIARISELEAQASELRKFRKAAYSMELELTGFRRRRALRLLDRFRMRGDLSEEISPAFTRLRDDSYLLIPNLRGFVLQVSDNIRDESFVSYPLESLRSGLQGILLAPVIDLPLSDGELGIEIVSPENEIILQSTKRAIEIDPTEPFRFDFAPIPNTVSGRFLLRVFVRDVDASIRLFEWRKYRLFGFAPIETRAFAGFIFDES